MLSSRVDCGETEINEKMHVIKDLNSKLSHSERCLFELNTHLREYFSEIKCLKEKIAYLRESNDHLREVSEEKSKRINKLNEDNRDLKVLSLL